MAATMLIAESVSDALYEDEDARACADIADSACTNVPGNFFRQAGALSLTKLGDAVTDAKTTLPWLVASLGGPGWIATLLVPIRESGSMLPQLAIAHWVRRKPRRKWTFALGALLQPCEL